MFDGPQIRKLMNYEDFIRSMIPREALAWQAFVNVAQNFLENNRSKNYIKIVKNLNAKFQGVSTNISIQLHFLFSRLDRFQKNMGSASNKH